MSAKEALSHPFLNPNGPEPVDGEALEHELYDFVFENNQDLKLN